MNERSCRTHAYVPRKTTPHCMENGCLQCVLCGEELHATWCRRLWT